MKCLLVGLVMVQFLFVGGIPVESNYEIEKQRLVKFPEETIPNEKNEQKSIEAKRILEEINKINVALGYIKKQETHVPSFLDSNQFLFPQPSYHPYHSQINNGILQASIRNLRPFKIQPQSSQHQLFNEPKKMFYYYVPKSSVVPSSSATLQRKLRIPVEISTKIENEYANENSPTELQLINYEVITSKDSSSKEKQALLNQNDNNSPIVRLYLIPRELKLNEKLQVEKKPRIEKLTTIRPYFKTTTEKQRLNTKAHISSLQKQISGSLPTTTLSPPLSSLKTPFASFFNRPANVITAQKETKTKPIMQSVPLTSPQTAQQSNIQASSGDDYRWEMESSEEMDYPLEFEKHIFSAKRKEIQNAEIQKEALKESGVIIQRLKVRKGGIAIAGPGGVATAGSGGTAIVGPGGYALTHPRSLTIAGPGAKVIAIPSTTDLKDALLRSNSERSYFNEGKLVATGPVIYFAPDNNGEV